MEKKKYMRPVCEVTEFEIRDSLLVGSNRSLDIVDSEKNGIKGCANLDGGFIDIWGNEQ